MASGIHTPTLEFIQMILSGPPHTTGFFSTASHQPKSQFPIMLYAFLTNSVDFYSPAFSFWHQHSSKTRLSPFITTQIIDSRNPGWSPEETNGQTHSSPGVSLQGRVMRRSSEARERNHGAKQMSSWKWSEVRSEGEKSSLDG